jgi:hypothetical protein
MIPQVQSLKVLKQPKEQLGREGHKWNNNRLETNRRAKTEKMEESRDGCVKRLQTCKM